MMQDGPCLSTLFGRIRLLKRCELEEELEWNISDTFNTASPILYDVECVCVVEGVRRGEVGGGEVR